MSRVDTFAGQATVPPPSIQY